MVLFLHGLGQDSSSWDSTRVGLDSCTAMDSPNLFSLGDSSSSLVYEELYKEFERYCQHCEEPVDLCGLSLGGIVALNYTIESPRASSISCAYRNAVPHAKEVVLLAVGSVSLFAERVAVSFVWSREKRDTDSSSLHKTA